MALAPILMQKQMNSTDRSLIEQNALFSGMDIENCVYMLDRSFLSNLDVGNRLLQPDTQNYHLHLILDGALSVYLVSQETDEHMTLHAGECVGEVSLIDGKYPSAIVIASEPTRILSIPYDTVWSLVNNIPEVAGNLLAILASRLRNGNKTMVDSQHLRKQLEQQAYVDALTGVYNRRWMEKAFPRTLHRCIRNKQPFVVMIVDIDHFKKVNDTYGHLVGDVALKAVAKCMAENMRPHDLLVRYGGEEFAMLLTEADLDSTKIIAERLLTRISEVEICANDISFHMTISIGITPTQRDDLQSLLQEADQALYRAKQTGRNRVEIFAN